jgi:hypothetical protein
MVNSNQLVHVNMVVFSFAFILDFFTTRSIRKTCFIIVKGHIKGEEFGKIVCEQNINVWEIVLEDDNFGFT